MENKNEEKEDILTVEQPAVEKFEQPAEKDLAQEAMARQEEISDKLAETEPQTDEQVAKKSFLDKIKNIFKGKSPEEYEAIGIEAINAHPSKLKMYNQYKNEDEEKAQKYAVAVGKDPGTKYWGYDEEKKDFVKTGIHSVASGEGTGGV